MIVGYILHGDETARVLGYRPHVVCKRCYARMFSLNGHRVPRARTRRMLGIVDIRQDDRARACHSCGNAIV